jgi:hypothetical protein
MPHASQIPEPWHAFLGKLDREARGGSAGHRKR